MTNCRLLAIATVYLLAASGGFDRPANAQVAERKIDFPADIRPILAEKCWHCHGPDAAAREGELRLDLESAAHAFRDGNAIIAPGHPERSLLYQRVIATDPDLRMPPADQQRQLTNREKELLKRWIQSGGQYDRHWSFQPLAQPLPPAVANALWIRNDIDRFVLAKLRSNNLSPSPAADRNALLRRVTMDLTGLPPTPAEIDAFLTDSHIDAYERLVDRLLNSPAYGERLTLMWLDVARFADSGGYQGDILRSMWLWRDWVISAYNNNMPFDQFTTEQLAGDLLPSPSESQRIATGFNRNHRINDEGGIIPEEFRVEYVADRVETTATVWLGLTVGCARCHDHKYDPIPTRDYYRLFGFFNSIAENGRGNGNAPPLLKKPTPAMQQQIDNVDKQIAAAKMEAISADAKTAAAAKKKSSQLQKKKKQLEAAVPSVMVMQELAERRPTFILVRGAYDQHGEVVEPGVLSSIGPRQESENGASGELSRLHLANWILHPENPLTARVAVNRYWQMYFGRGIVETTEDFGAQGALPSHPQLLDWLAAEFVRSGWDIKAMQRLIVTSATYRQSSSGTPELVARDPSNRLLARASRFRLHAETIRDQALAASGLLVGTIGGPSVRPYQPPGMWDELASASRKYVPSQGGDLYRRSMYTFIRRTVPHPAMTTIDAPDRELCTVRRQRTNTPTQALVLMNDPQLIEAARALAETVMRSARDEPSRIRNLALRVLARPLTRLELKAYQKALAAFRARYRSDEPAAKALVSVGDSKADVELPVDELAAWTAVANLILNLDETVTRE